MLKTKTPKYVERFVDRLGHPRFYFRRKLGPHVALPGLPWSLEFMAVYDVAERPADAYRHAARADERGRLVQQGD